MFEFNADDLKTNQRGQLSPRQKDWLKIVVRSAVPGRVPQPYSFGVEGRAAPGYTYPERPVGFVREILASTRRAPL